MKTIYIGFKDNPKTTAEFKYIYDKYKNKVHFITNRCNRRCSQVRILYSDGMDLKKYVNKDVLIVNNWQDVEAIIEFYLKYDYKTLEKLK